MANNASSDASANFLANLLSTLPAEEIQFQKYWATIRRRWLPIVGLTVLSSGIAAFYSLCQSPRYVASGKLMLKMDSTSALTGLENEPEKLQALTTKSDPLSTQAEIVRSEPIAKKAIAQFKLADESGEPLSVQAFSRDLSVRQMTGTDILQISYTGDNPKRAAEIVNFVMQAYLTRNRESNRADAIAARKFIETQIPASQTAVTEAESRLKTFKENSNVVELDKEVGSTVETLTNLRQQITQTEIQLAQATTRSTALSQQLNVTPEVALTLSNLNQSESVKKARADWDQARSQLIRERARFSPKHPAIDLLRRQEAEARSVYEARIREISGNNSVPLNQLQIGETGQEQIGALADSEVNRRALASQLTALKQAEARYSSRSRQLPELEKTHRELERQRNAAQETYKALLTNRQEALVRENQTAANTEIVATADPPDKPVSARLLLMLAAGGAIGLVLGIIFAFLSDRNDRSVRSLKDARSLFGYPLLGVIPKVELSTYEEHGSSRSMQHRTVFPAQEAYQMLHANLKLLKLDQPIQSLVVTSAGRQEGKSTIAANLAVAMTQVQRRVLLIDADFRNPAQHHLWGLTNQFGLSNVLVGQVPFSAAVQQITSNLHVLSVGTIPPNPIALLDSQRMRELIESFTQVYDVVLLDTPALSGTADTAILNTMVDGALLVVRPGVVDVPNAIAAKQFLAQSGQTILGVVVNDVVAEKEPEGTFYATQADQNSFLNNLL
ncbi:polysaccharide biosynthesis tyrosine autokinase [Pseudanabaenaceae cyanobacterium LEGE 13415]|nr:polysaccharide biosynthesis tyrosine autokinase [Pseudanabaenaceae cyanobacterium LEGE 13415]